MSKRYGNKKFDLKQAYRGFWGKFNQAKNFPEIAGKQIRMYFDFKTAKNEKIKVKFALSPVSTEGALLNLKTETPDWNFEKVKQATQNAWNQELNKMVIEGEIALKQNFYTAMYHAFISPTTYMDVDGRYMGLDQNVHKAEGFTNYTTFSLWDTYRALHPLFNLIQPKRNGDMIKSMMVHYDQNIQKMLPVWSHYGNENWCMSGYHSVSIIADAIIKGNTPFDANKALDACIVTSNHRNFDGLGDYIDKGYVPNESSGNSVSTTMEYAYDDWCIAQAAKKLGRKAIYEKYLKRSENYKNVFDPSVGFMRPKLKDGTFRKDFDVLSTNGQGFIEGNTWNYSLFVPQDPVALIALNGGKAKFTRHLDSLFTMELPDKFFAETEDITRDGIIGNYVHGNEPSHHVAYLYNWTDEPWKTQERVRMILPKMYAPRPDGLGGNDDCGQMSAWYIFSTLGFYPVAPGSDQYSIGSPSITKAILHLENGKTFEIDVQNQSEKNVYVHKIMLNGQFLQKLSISHGEIMNGGKIIFFMTADRL